MFTDQFERRCVTFKTLDYRENRFHPIRDDDSISKGGLSLITRVACQIKMSIPSLGNLHLEQDRKKILEPKARSNSSGKVFVNHFCTYSIWLLSNLIYFLIFCKLPRNKVKNSQKKIALKIIFKKIQLGFSLFL